MTWGLERDADGDLTEAQEAIDWLARTQLRLRALLARARGDQQCCELADRYRAMAESLGFEGHSAWAEEMAHDPQ